MRVSRWKEAQDLEQSYWNKVRSNTSWLGAKLREMLNFLEVIVHKTQGADSVLEIGIGPLGLGIINFYDARHKFAIEPLPIFEPRFCTNRVNQWIMSSRERVNYVRGTIEHLPFCSSSFDLVVVWNVLDHVLNPLEGMMEVRRVLRKGGHLVLAQDVHSLAGLIRMKLRHDWIARAHPWNFSKWSLFRLLSQSEFTEIYTIASGSLVTSFIGKAKRWVLIAK